MAVDIARRPYTTTARFFTNSDQQIKVRWVPADPARGTFPGVSRVCSLDWVTHPETAEGVGEVYGTSRNYNRGKPFTGIVGNHFCGTLDEHRNGEVFDPTKPPMLYQPSGLPLCCDPNRREADGLIAVGGSSYAIYSNPYRSSGKIATDGHTTTINGAERYSSGVVAVSYTAFAVTIHQRFSTGLIAVGGSASGVTGETFHSAGLVALKGESTAETSIPCPEWQPTCLLCGLGQVDNPCYTPLANITDEVPVDPSGWRIWQLVPNTDYEWVANFLAGIGTQGGWELRLGHSCLENVLHADGSFIGFSTVTHPFNSGEWTRLFAILTAPRSSVTTDLELMVNTL